MDDFKCSKCVLEKGCEKSGFNYHCYNCNHVESATGNTLFHKVRFGLHIQSSLLSVLDRAFWGKLFSSLHA